MTRMEAGNRVVGYGLIYPVARFDGVDKSEHTAGKMNREMRVMCCSGIEYLLSKIIQMVFDRQYAPDKTPKLYASLDPNKENIWQRWKRRSRTKEILVHRVQGTVYSTVKAVSVTVKDLNNRFNEQRGSMRQQIPSFELPAKNARCKAC